MPTVPPGRLPRITSERLDHFSYVADLPPGSRRGWGRGPGVIQLLRLGHSCGREDLRRRRSPPSEPWASRSWRAASPPLRLAREPGSPNRSGDGGLDGSPSSPPSPAVDSVPAGREPSINKFLDRWMPSTAREQGVDVPWPAEFTHEVSRIVDRPPGSSGARRGPARRILMMITSRPGGSLLVGSLGIGRHATGLTPQVVRDLAALRGEPPPNLLGHASRFVGRRPSCLAGLRGHFGRPRCDLADRMDGPSMGRAHPGRPAPGRGSSG